MNTPNLILFLFSIILIVSCKKGNQVENIPPETTIAISKINLSGQNRLESVLTLEWSGFDKDGYVVAFEISFDNMHWQNVGEKEDSTFTFILGQGIDSVDIDFYVRAIDNKGAVDPTPSFLEIPIKDTPPTVSLAKLSADTAYVVLALAWNATDIEGQQAIDSFFIKINSGKWVALSNQVSMVTFIPSDPTVKGAVSTKIYVNSEATLLSQQIEGLLLNDTNRIYIKARDISGEYSNTDSTQAIYIKNKSSDLLVIGADANASPESIYFPILSSVYGKYDFVNYIVNSGQNIPVYWNPAFTLYISLYKKVFIYTDNTTIGNSQSLLLELAASSFQSFLNQGGKLLISAALPTSLNAESDLFEFLPLDSLPSSYYGSPRSANGSFATPDSINAVGYPKLIRSSTDASRVSPFFPQASAFVIYTADITKGGRPVTPWMGSTVIGAKTINANSKTNMMFFSAELHLYNGDNAALQQLFSKILSNEFNW